MYRLIYRSRTEPVRTIIFVVCVVLVITQAFSLSPWYTFPNIEGLKTIPAQPPVADLLPNALIGAALGGYGIWASWKDNMKHMAWASFGLFLLFLLAALTRVLFAPTPTDLMWIPTALLALVHAIGYLYMSYQHKRGR